MQQIMQNYTPVDKQVWKTLFERQRHNLEMKGAQAYLDCLDDMKSVLNANTIPNFDHLNQWFSKKTGWTIEVVPGLIPVSEFFELLSEKKFPSSTWLRSLEQLDYLEEPDMFHDIFGHVPLLADKTFSEFTHKFGQIGKSFKEDPFALIQLQRLYWFTIEFGVIFDNNEIRSYGAGILSSFDETNRVAKQNCTFIPFDIDLVLNRFFETDVLQENYFVIQSFDTLKLAIEQANVLLSRKIYA